MKVGQIWYGKNNGWYSNNGGDGKYDSVLYLRIKEKSTSRENAWVLEKSNGFGKDFKPAGTFDHTEEDLKKNYIAMSDSEDYYKPKPKFQKVKRVLSLDQLDYFPFRDIVSGFWWFILISIICLVLLLSSIVFIKNERIEKRDVYMQEKGYTVIESGRAYQKGSEEIYFLRGIPVKTDVGIIEDLGCKVKQGGKGNAGW